MITVRNYHLEYGNNRNNLLQTGVFARERFWHKIGGLSLIYFAIAGGQADFIKVLSAVRGTITLNPEH